MKAECDLARQRSGKEKIRSEILKEYSIIHPNIILNYNSIPNYKQFSSYYGGIMFRVRDVQSTREKQKPGSLRT